MNRPSRSPKTVLMTIAHLTVGLLLTVACGTNDGSSGSAPSSPDQAVKQEAGTTQSAEQEAGTASAEQEAGTSLSILLVTLDTTRADRLGFAGAPVETPNLDGLAARGVRFDHAYTTAPTTLPAHASMLTGLYPSIHGIRENARYLSAEHPLATESLAAAGYRTGAFVSGFPLARQFGLARGFDHFDDRFEGAERDAGQTTDRALEWLERSSPKPTFLWVHYFDPHDPYQPPEPFASQYSDPYLGEIAYMDQELGRLLEGFERRHPDDHRILVVGDHGEGLGDHGERLHGNLLYQGVMRVPLLIAGTGIEPATVEDPVSNRRVASTLLAWAGVDFGPGQSLLTTSDEVVMGEAMKPFLHYGWQPQVMAIDGPIKAIRAGDLEIFDIVADPGETTNLAATAELDRDHRRALRDYPFIPVQSGASDAEARLSDEDRARLASLGYVGWSGAAGARGSAIRDDAPNPRDMTAIFAALDAGSAHFVARRYPAAVARFETVQAADPNNLMVAVRLAVANSILGRDAEARAQFDRARTIAPESLDVRHYLGQHYRRQGRLDDASALFESVLARQPDRLATREALGLLRADQGRVEEARAMLESIVDRLRSPSTALLRLGDLAMATGDTESAISYLERTRHLEPDRFPRHLELGVLYLAARRFEDARDSLDLALEHIPRSHPAHAMALFKRAQASVLLGEPDQSARIQAARDGADATTRPMIEREPLFQRPRRSQ